MGKENNKSTKKSKWDNPGCYTPCGIGGQALLEGVMMRGKKSTAICCRNEKGETLLYTERNKPRTGIQYKMPILRGIVSFFISLFSGVKYITKSADVYAGEDEESKIGPIGMLLTVLISFVFAIALFIALPRLIHWLVWDVLVGLSNLVENSIYILIISLTDGLIKVLVLIAYMWLTSLNKDIKRTYMYHGAEHKTINCYEHNLELTVENVQSCSTRHARCGTTFLFYTIIVSIIVITLVLWGISFTGFNVELMKSITGNDILGTLLYNIINIGISILCVPIMAGISYELLQLVAKAPDNKFFLIFKAPGFALQALTTKEPEDEMVDAAIKAFKTVIEMDADSNIPEKDFYEMLYPEARKWLLDCYEKAGIDDESEVDWMLCYVLEKKRNELRTVVKLSKEQTQKLKECAKKRADGMPLDYVTGESFFLNNKLFVSNAVHLPRMETEQVALKAIELIKEKGYKSGLDLMTGSGCIALALKTETGIDITASDISDEALEVAKKNLEGKATLVKSELLDNISGIYDIIVSNPPYIRSGEISTLANEVKCQPLISLDGGEDGLDYYKKIALVAQNYLSDGGAIVVEIGHDQASSVKAIFDAGGWKEISVFKDMSGSDRMVVAFKG